jgi:anti-anti-sigma factor
LLLSGEIDMSNGPVVTEWIITAVTAGATRLDLSSVSFISAAGVSALIAGRDAGRSANTRLTVVRSPMVLRVLSLCLSEADGLTVLAADGTNPVGDAR